jgi:hypothetical protein
MAAALIHRSFQHDRNVKGAGADGRQAAGTAQAE